MPISALVNSSGFNFYIYWSNNKYTVVGRHGFHDFDDEFSGDFGSSSEVVSYLKQYIPTWCAFSIGQYENFEDQSELVYHQVFGKIDSIGDKGTTLSASLEMLEKS